MQQVAVFKKLNEHTEEELAQNPQLLADLNNHDKEQEEILIEEGLGSEYDPPFAVFEMAGLKFRNDPTMRMQIAKIEEGYQRSIHLFIQFSCDTLPKSKTGRSPLRNSTTWRTRSSSMIPLFD